MASPTLHTTIVDLETATWKALQTTGAAMTPFCATDCIMQFPLGLKLTATSKPSVQDILHSPAFVPWKTFSLHNVDVLAVGPEGAVISYLARATRAGAQGAGRSEGGEPGEDRDVEFEALCSSVWRLEQGKWLLCLHQQTMVE